MCGIICGSLQKIVTSQIEQSLKLINHRGPDSSNYILIDKNKFLGHVRLSIVDLNGGTQPIINEDNSIFVSVNGEFYNHLEIREDLILKGHTFKTHSDSEILVHLYEEFGVECLKFLHGEFAFVLYDKKQKRWFAARDRFGIRPLQYYYKNNNLLITSEAKALKPFNLNLNFDKESFWFSQHLQYLPKDKTLFKDVSMIQPGHFLIIEDGKEAKQIEYWNLKNIENKNISFEEAKEKTLILLKEAVQKRIPKEVQWTSHLSGGIDSSIISYLSHQEHEDRTCFTIQFTDDSFYDESVLAIETAKKINAKLEIIPMSFSEILKNIPKAVYHGEGLSINGHLGAKYLLNKKIREAGFKVAFSGEGADEIFMGYSHLKQDYLSNQALNSQEKTYLKGIQLPDGETLNLDIIRNEFGFVPTWIQAKSSIAYKLKQFWHSNFEFTSNPYELILPDLKGFSSKLKTSSASWTKYCLNSYILKVLDDGQSMAHSVEGRLPFLDTQLVEFVFSLPDDLFFQNNIEKFLLRDNFKNILPDSVINKTKQSFMSPPLNRFINNQQFINLLEEYVLDNQKLKDLQLFNNETIKSFIQSNNQDTSFESIVMILLCTGIFIKELI